MRASSRSCSSSILVSFGTGTPCSSSLPLPTGSASAPAFCASPPQCHRRRRCVQGCVAAMVDRQAAINAAARVIAAANGRSAALAVGCAAAAAGNPVACSSFSAAGADAAGISARAPCLPPARACAPSRWCAQPDGRRPSGLLAARLPSWPGTGRARADRPTRAPTRVRCRASTARRVRPLPGHRAAGGSRRHRRLRRRPHFAMRMVTGIGCQQVRRRPPRDRPTSWSPAPAGRSIGCTSSDGARARCDAFP